MLLTCVVENISLFVVYIISLFKILRNLSTIKAFYKYIWNVKMGTCAALFDFVNLYTTSKAFWNKNDPHWCQHLFVYIHVHICYRFQRFLAYTPSKEIFSYASFDWEILILNRWYKRDLGKVLYMWFSIMI